MHGQVSESFGVWHLRKEMEKGRCKLAASVNQMLAAGFEKGADTEKHGTGAYAARLTDCSRESDLNFLLLAFCTLLVDLPRKATGLRPASLRLGPIWFQISH